MGGGSGGGGSSTTVQKADPWAGVQPYLSEAYARANGLYGGAGPQYYPGQAVASPNYLEGMGQNQTMANMGMMGLAGQNAFGASQNMMTGAQNQLANGQQLQGNATTNMQNMAQYLNGATPYGMSALDSMLSQATQASGGIGTVSNAAGQLAGYGTSGGIQAGQSGTMNAMNQLMAAGNPANNPYFQSAVNSAIRPVTENFNEQVMPAIRQGAQAAGQMGSSRQGIAEGIAARGYQDTVGDISANMGNAAYAQGLQAMNSAGQLGQGLTSQGLGALSTSGALGQGLAGLSANSLANAGSLSQGMTGMGASLQSQLASLGQNGQENALTNLGRSQALIGDVQGGLAYPGSLMTQMGQQNTADQQAQINAGMQQWNYNQNLPYSMISDYLQLLQGAPGSQTTQQSAGGGSRLSGALGGAASGAALGSFGGPMGMGVGAGLGALYGLFM
ncbi:hypothetical protein HP546_19040 [Pseudomonas sp. CM25]|uniref:hypothetical protein n=1 Tax=Pseudomonas sp. CM25 TaxID=2738448 RepID=UPI0015576CD7|nr:hypothetical protein [Pseudomonas sp. CM25]NQD57435.1 hypothetical protein [Pseudomonas sp. CM25]